MLGARVFGTKDMSFIQTRYLEKRFVYNRVRTYLDCRHSERDGDEQDSFHTSYQKRSVLHDNIAVINSGTFHAQH